MKETRFFYVPNAESSGCLPEDESNHALRVLRMKAGDEMMLMDGVGTFYKAVVSGVSRHACLYDIVEAMPQRRQWPGLINIAMAPTKMIDRTEWMVEKATEIGLDGIALLDCAFSERHTVKAERLEKIAVSAMKQSRKPWKPTLDGMMAFRNFVDAASAGNRFIAHCYEEIPRTYLFDELRHANLQDGTTVLIGPEGAFSMAEVEYAMGKGFVSVHLGESRMRTETAAVVATTMVHLASV